MQSIILEQRVARLREARRVIAWGMAVNLALALVKFAAGFFGHTYALIADAIESLVDVLASCTVFAGLTVAASPPSERYPYGRGRTETLAAMIVSGFLFAAAATIATHSITEIRTPHQTPAPFTLLVLLGVIATKEALFRYLLRTGSAINSVSIQSDALHQRSDALTSVAAGIGILLAIIGGPGYESADDWAALFASAVIAINGFVILRSSLTELLDRSPDSGIAAEICAIAAEVPGVAGTHRCNIRKLGIDLVVDLDILVPGAMSVTEGHDLAHKVSDSIRQQLPLVFKVLVHVEPLEADSRGNPRTPEDAAVG